MEILPSILIKHASKPSGHSFFGNSVTFSLNLNVAHTFESSEEQSKHSNAFTKIFKYLFCQLNVFVRKSNLLLTAYQNRA